jgi:carbon storage regulator
MLVLSRQRDESIMIGDTIKITIVQIKGDKVRIGIEAPRDIEVHREEVYKAIRALESEDSKNLEPKEPEILTGKDSKVLDSYVPRG